MTSILWFFSSSSSGDESLKRFTSEVRDQLLLGLSDESEDIRYVVTIVTVY